MDWDKLRIFYYVAKAGSLTSAGDYLHISHSALSRSIKILEDRFGAKLFNRHARGLILTKNGEILLSHVKKILLEIDEAQDHILGHSDRIQGNLSITTTFGFASTVLFDYLCDFSLRYPDILLSVICNDENLNLTFGEADVAIRPYDLNGYELIQTFLKKRILGLYASKQYLEEFGVPEKTIDLDNHQLIVFTNPNNTLPYANTTWPLLVGNEQNYIRKPFMLVNSTECMVQAAQKGLGIITLSDDSSLIKSANLIRVLPHLEGPISKMYFVYPKTIKKLRIVKFLYEFLKECFKIEDEENNYPFES
jgi:DNA-binding transcriptional LysR family regulator